jgi:hypothetical protein
MNENARKLARFRAALEVRGDGKCYCPCNDCRGLQRIRLLITTTERHCREKGHAEGGNEYHPLVRGYSIFNVFSLMVIMS